MAAEKVGKIWTCKIGETEDGSLPMGSDAPMRRAVIEAYRKLTGKEPDFAFTGWGGELTEGERRVVNESPRRGVDGIYMAGTQGRRES